MKQLIIAGILIGLFLAGTRLFDPKLTKDKYIEIMVDVGCNSAFTVNGEECKKYTALHPEDTLEKYGVKPEDMEEYELKASRADYESAMQEINDRIKACHGWSD